MFLRESVEYCAICQEMTPHSRRRVAWPVIVGAAALVGGVTWLVREAEPTMGGAIAIVAALLLLVLDRRRRWRIACERCRGKRQRLQPRLLPPAGRNMEIGLG